MGRRRLGGLLAGVAWGLMGCPGPGPQGGPPAPGASVGLDRPSAPPGLAPGGPAQAQALGALVGPISLLVGQSLELPTGSEAAPISWRLADPEASAARLAPSGPLDPGPAPEAGGGALPPRPTGPWRLVGLAPGALGLVAQQGGAALELWVPLKDPAVQGAWLRAPFAPASWTWSPQARVIRSQAELDAQWAQASPQAGRRLLVLPFPEPSLGGAAPASPAPEGPQVAFPGRQLLLVPRPAGAGELHLVAIQGRRVRLAQAEVRPVLALPSGALTPLCPARAAGLAAGPGTGPAGRMQAFVVPALPEGPPELELLPFLARGCLP